MKQALVASATLGVLLHAQSSFAQTAMDADYRRADRRTFESPQHFAFEARLGPYAARVDEQFLQKPGPFERTFGPGNGVYFGMEIDWQALRIPFVGTFGPGFGWGYTRRTANANLTPIKIVDQNGNVTTSTPEVSAEQTHLTIMPMYLVGVLRIDVLAREMSIPIVPYGKAGIGMGLWSASTDSGVSERANPQGQDLKIGRGRTWGTQLALGGMLLLDGLDEPAALGFDEEVGVNNSYVFFEWQLADLAGQLPFIESGPQMHIGSSSWVMGIAVEF